MATSQETMDYIMDQLSALPTVRSRKMFGEHAIYCEEKVVALVCNDQVFVKITEPGKALVGKTYEEGAAYAGAKPSMVIDAGVLDDHEQFCTLIRATAEALPAPKPKKPRKPKKPTTK